MLLAGAGNCCNQDKYEKKKKKILKVYFYSFLSRYQISLETQMRGSDFIFGWVNLLYFKCQKLNFEHGGSCIDSPDLMKKKKSNNKSKT